MTRRLPFTFPFYEDEIYFSWLARYHQRSVNATSQITSKQIFGWIPNVRPDRVFLLDRFCEATGFNTDEIIEEHSTLPYYRSSFSEQKYQQMVRSVKEEAVTKYPMYGVGVGQQYMKYCPLCTKEDLETYGVVYWHVSHNLDGITICPEHHVRLLNDNTPFTSRRRTYALPPYKEDDFAIYEEDPDELRFNAMISDSWRSERYSKEEMLTLIRTLSKIQYQVFDYNPRFTEDLSNDPTIIKLAKNRGIERDDLDRRFERLLKDKNVAYHPFYTYLIRDYLGLTKEVAGKIVEVYPNIFHTR